MTGKIFLIFSCLDKIPIMKPGIYMVRASYNKIHLSEPMHRFVYRTRLILFTLLRFAYLAGGTAMQIAVYSFQMEPRAGPASGGTQILVHGTNLNRWG